MKVKCNNHTLTTVNLRKFGILQLKSHCLAENSEIILKGSDYASEMIPYKPTSLMGSCKELPTKNIDFYLFIPFLSINIIILLIIITLIIHWKSQPMKGPLLLDAQTNTYFPFPNISFDFQTPHYDIPKSPRPIYATPKTITNE